MFEAKKEISGEKKKKGEIYPIKYFKLSPRNQKMNLSIFKFMLGGNSLYFFESISADIKFPCE